VNIEELELSLRSEVESQLKNVVEEIRKDAADLQKRFEAEFEKHRAELDRLISEFAARIPDGNLANKAFNETISEHLRLARDEGAQIAATAFGEAEKLKAAEQAAASTAKASFDSLRDAINEISSQSTQAGILTALVEQSRKFAARGAFFIVKNNSFIGWKTFGESEETPDEKIRQLQFPVNTDSTLAVAVRSLNTALSTAGAHLDDARFLGPLNFGSPEKLTAVPLIARGRAVAVLYADCGPNDQEINIEALETLVRVAGLTVELLAANQLAVFQGGAKTASAETASGQPGQQAQSHYQEQPVENYSQEESKPAQSTQFTSQMDNETPSEESVDGKASDTSGQISYEIETTYAVEATETQREYTGSEYIGDVSVRDEQPAASFETTRDSVPAASEHTQVETAPSYYEVEYTSTAPIENEFQTVGSDGANGFEITQNRESAEFVPAAEANNFEGTYTAESSAETVTASEVPVVDSLPKAEASQYPFVETAGVGSPPVRSRVRDRNIDLPIEVSDDERKEHVKARRFARLLVSEIRLYNEQKVVEGLEAGDLYERLREAIDRSRETYDRRVHPLVAAKFDYFHYEMVNSLAQGKAEKLGPGYPGPSV
jgi:hypothetical protein